MISNLSNENTVEMLGMDICAAREGKKILCHGTPHAPFIKVDLSPHDAERHLAEKVKSRDELREIILNRKRRFELG